MPFTQEKYDELEKHAKQAVEAVEKIKDIVRRLNNVNHLSQRIDHYGIQVTEQFKNEGPTLDEVLKSMKDEIVP